MKEEFTNALGDYICFSDEGLEFKTQHTHRMYPYGSLSMLKISLGAVQIKPREDTSRGAIFAINKQDKKRMKALIEETNKTIASAPDCKPYNLDDDGNRVDLPAQKQVKLKDREFRKRCNVCGTVFCYTMKDIKNNIASGFTMAFSGMGAVANAAGGSAYNAYELNKMGDRSKAQVMDLNHCPNCHSTDLKELTDEEFEKIKQEQNAPAANTISAADELKKFKELLDMGAITQEEFDAKKKQLLGL